MIVKSRHLLVLFLFAVPIMLVWGRSIGAQSASGGTICAIVFADANQNGRHDPGEDPVLNVNIDLLINSGSIVVRNHVTSSTDPYCFADLPPVQYTLTIDSPLYAAVDPSPYTFALAAGDHLTHEFGVIAKPAVTTSADNILNIPLTQPIRLALSTASAAIVMAVFGGFGLFLYGLFLHPPRRRKIRQAAVDESSGEQRAMN